ncbi:phosphopantetheine-binding protein, partial [Mycobacterium timonense]|uniref:phosphopantetheine-binding protein n=1 Tax=Mycobacterium timonense TaxID=701043 RepID=UPI0035A33878
MSPNQAPGQSIRELRSTLAQRLPEYMVPTAVVVLDALPLTVNGKLDTRALPAPEFQNAGYRAPARRREILAGIYADVLGIECVSVDDSFFDLGGDSLLAMRVIAAIETSLNADLSVRTVFEAPTVTQLAPASVAMGRGVSRWWRWSDRRWFRCRLPSSGWFIDQLLGPSPIYNMAALRLSGRLDAEALGALADGGPPGEPAHPVPVVEGYRSRWSSRWSGPTSVGRSSMPPAGRRPAAGGHR